MLKKTSLSLQEGYFGSRNLKLSFSVKLVQSLSPIWPIMQISCLQHCVDLRGVGIDGPTQQEGGLPYQIKANIAVGNAAWRVRELSCKTSAMKVNLISMTFTPATY